MNHSEIFHLSAGSTWSRAKRWQIVLEPVSKVPVVNHRQPGTAFGNRQEPFSLGGSNRSICPIAGIADSQSPGLSGVKSCHSFSRHSFAKVCRSGQWAARH
jgi:hypothetical protein